MGGEQNRQVLERLVEAVNSQDLDTYEAQLDENVVYDWPQSGERIVGRHNIMAINRNYPGLPEVKTRRIIGRDDLWIVEATLDYQGKIVHSVSVAEFRDGRIARDTVYFAEPFDAPAWRAQWVERISVGEGRQA